MNIRFVTQSPVADPALRGMGGIFITVGDFACGKETLKAPPEVAAHKRFQKHRLTRRDVKFVFLP